MMLTNKNICPQKYSTQSLDYKKFTFQKNKQTKESPHNEGKTQSQTAANSRNIKRCKQHKAVSGL